MSDIPEWAVRRASVLASEDGNYYDAFARYIAQHEQPPVDRLREVALAIEKEWADGSDTVFTVVERVLRDRLPQAALDAIERGE